MVEERAQQKEVEQWLWAPEQTEEGGSETSQGEEVHKTRQEKQVKMRFPVEGHEERMEEVKMSGFQPRGWDQDWVARLRVTEALWPVEAEGS